MSKHEKTALKVIAIVYLLGAVYYYLLTKNTTEAIKWPVAFFSPVLK